MNKILRITMICPYFVPFPGGQELHTAFLIKYLKRLNVKISIITSNIQNLKSYEKKENVEIYRLNPIFEIYTNPFSLKLFPLLMKIETDIFHVQGYWSIFANIAGLVAKLRRIPLIYTSHGFQLSLYNKNLLTRLIVFSYIRIMGLIMFKPMKLMTLTAGLSSWSMTLFPLIIWASTAWK